MISPKKQTSLNGEILKKLKLIQSVELKLKISKTKFIQNLKDNVDREDVNFLTYLLEPFSGGTCKYKGKVGHKGFILKKRSRLFDLGKNISVIEGTCKQKGKSLRVAIQIDGFRGGMKLYYALLSLIFLWYSANNLSSMIDGESDELTITIIILILQMIFLFGMPYLIMRRSIRYVKREILDDLSHLSK